MSEKAKKPSERIDDLEKQNAELKTSIGEMAGHVGKLTNMVGELMKVFNPPVNSQKESQPRGAGTATPAPSSDPSIPPLPGQGPGGAYSPSPLPSNMDEKTMKQYMQVELLRMFAPMITQLVTGQQNPMMQVMSETMLRMQQESMLSFMFAQRANVRRMATASFLTPEELVEYNQHLAKLGAPQVNPATTALNKLPTTQPGVSTNVQPNPSTNTP